jgi:hypothetical protein
MQTRKMDIEYFTVIRQDKVLKSSYTILQIKKGLSKAWIGYKIAKRKGEFQEVTSFLLDHS